MSNRKPRGAAEAAPAPAPVLETPSLVPPPALETQAVVDTPVLDVPAVTTVEASVDKTPAPVETKKTPKVVAAKPIKVRATAKGFYGNVRRKVDEVFEIKNEQAFSIHWMEKI